MLCVLTQFKIEKGNREEKLETASIESVQKVFCDGKLKLGHSWR